MCWQWLVRFVSRYKVAALGFTFCSNPSNTGNSLRVSIVVTGLVYASVENQAVGAVQRLCMIGGCDG